MRIALLVAATSGLFATAAAGTPAPRQDEGWAPYKFKKSERYEFKIVSVEDGKPKESGYVLDIKKKGEEFEVTYTVKATMKADDMGEKTILSAMGANVNLAWILVNPMLGAMMGLVPMKESTKTELAGMGYVQSGAKETIGGRTGIPFKWFIKKDDKDHLAWEVVIDAALALPLKSVHYGDDGKEQHRVELVGYKE